MTSGVVPPSCPVRTRHGDRRATGRAGTPPGMLHAYAVIGESCHRPGRAIAGQLRRAELHRVVGHRFAPSEAVQLAARRIPRAASDGRKGCAPVVSAALQLHADQAGARASTVSCRARTSAWAYGRGRGSQTCPLPKCPAHRPRSGACDGATRSCQCVTLSRVPARCRNQPLGHPVARTVTASAGRE
jgi:hypothetical protein